jgi:hypothetical protein
MKRIFTSLIVLTSLTLLLFPIAAQEHILIDFSLLGADFEFEGVRENKATLTAVDTVEMYSPITNAKNRFTSLAPNKWIILFLPSGLATEAAWVRETPVDSTALLSTSPSLNKTPVSVFEIKIDFSRAPTGTTAALLLPSFAIPPAADKTVLKDGNLVVPDNGKGLHRKFDSNGMLRNVAVLKTISIAINASRVDNQFGIVLRDNDGQNTIYSMGALDFEGWHRVVYANPEYIKQLVLRETRAGFGPVAADISTLRFNGLLIYASQSNPRAAVTIQIKEVSLRYDLNNSVR